MTKVYVGLGSNLGDPEANVRSAILALHDFVTVRRISSLYRTEPVGLKEQPEFINCVLSGDTDLTPSELVERFRAVEDDMGRERDVPMGPRPIDLDLLLYGDWIIREPDVEVPHPRMAERRFVLEPLSEISPNAIHPKLRATVARLLEGLPVAEAVERIEAEDWPPRPDPV